MPEDFKSIDGVIAMAYQVCWMFGRRLQVAPMACVACVSHSRSLSMTWIITTATVVEHLSQLSARRDVDG